MGMAKSRAPDCDRNDTIAHEQDKVFYSFVRVLSVVCAWSMIYVRLMLCVIGGACTFCRGCTLGGVCSVIYVRLMIRVRSIVSVCPSLCVYHDTRGFDTQGSVKWSKIFARRRSRLFACRSDYATGFDLQKNGKSTVFKWLFWESNKHRSNNNANSYLHYRCEAKSIYCFFNISSLLLFTI